MLLTLQVHMFDVKKNFLLNLINQDNFFIKNISEHPLYYLWTIQNKEKHLEYKYVYSLMYI